ncbi:hypothetical protein BH23DEI1_BH23DEI1_16220 [soil metagenome]
MTRDVTRGAAGDAYPFDVPAIRSFETIRFTTPVTIFVGENDSGKPFDDGAIRRVAFDDLEHVRLTRDFLADPEAFLRHL